MKGNKLLVARSSICLALIMLTLPFIAACAKPAPAPAEFEVISLDAKPPEVIAGETVSITAEVRNTGGSEGIYTAILTVNGATIETKDITVAAGATQKVTFSLVKDATGSYEIGIGGLTLRLTVFGGSADISPGLGAILNSIRHITSLYRFRKSPVLEPTPGTWDENGVMYPWVWYEDGKYHMLYSCYWGGERMKQIGYAYSMDGVNFTKAADPVIPNGSAGEWDERLADAASCVRRKNTYYLFYEGLTMSSIPGEPYGEVIGLATAASPEGPYTKSPLNPILSYGEPGEWDDQGCTSPAVLEEDGIFHVWYTGASATDVLEQGPRLIKVGYAFGKDPEHLTKHPGNPIFNMQANPGLAGDYACHMDVKRLGSLYVMLLSTKPTGGSWTIQIAVSYNKIDWIALPILPLIHEEQFPDVSYDYVTRPCLVQIGSKVLIYIGGIGAPSTIHLMKGGEKPAVELLTVASIEAGATSTLTDSMPLLLSDIDSLALTVNCTYNASATAGLRIHVRSSYDGINYDDADLYQFDNEFTANTTKRKTVELNPKVRFIKVLAENLDSSYAVTDVKVTATWGG